MSRFLKPGFTRGTLESDVINTNRDERDVVFARAGDDTVTTGAGDDVLIGGLGDDSLDAGSGDDRIAAGDGDDIIRSGSGNDMIRGGKGFDTLVVEGALEDYDIFMHKNGRNARLTDIDSGDVDTLRFMEAIYFEADDYTLLLDGSNNVVVARDDEATVAADATLLLSDLTANDIDGDGDVLTITAIDSTGTQGVVTLNNDGTVSFDPAGAFDNLVRGKTATTTFTVTVSDGNGSFDTSTVTVTIEGVADPAPEPSRVWINEFHYDDEGTDNGEFIEISGDAGVDLSGWSVVLYNGANGTVYNTISLSDALTDSGNGLGFQVLSLPTNGLQNGGPDGIALVNTAGEVVEFISYEGEFEAANGPAAGQTSRDVGVSENGSTSDGSSIQRVGVEDEFVWEAVSGSNTAGAINQGQSTGNGGGDEPDEPIVVINEFHYDNEGGDVGEFIEIKATTGTDLSGWSIVLYNGNGGRVYDTEDLSGLVTDSGDGFGYIVIDYPSNGIQNGASDGIALVDGDGNVVEFLSYEGTLTAVDGPAAGLTSTDIEVSETSGTPIGQSLQRQDDGSWAAPADNTKGAANDGSTGGGGGGDTPGDVTLISAIQGAGDTTAFEGEVRSVEAVVTAVLANGFYLQEEDNDADSDASTSEGLWVFTGGAPSVSVGNVVLATGEVGEFFGLTQMELDSFDITAEFAELPSMAELNLPLTTSANLESLEGMRISLDTAPNEAPLTIIENFNFDRFGELTLSAGRQIQPTQLYDAQTQADEVAQLQEQNQLNRILIDDGLTEQNPTSFGYIANNTAGDDGDGILSAGDDFSVDGPTLRLGTELTAPVNGIMSFGFGDYRLLPTEVLAIDEATNSGAREPNAPEVEGDLIAASVNVLNYFTTLGSRGASTEADLARQTEKLVNTIVEMDADVIGLQEIENNGFAEGSAIDTFVDAINARLGSEVYAYVDPSNGAPIGTDVITTGVIYKIDEVNVVEADYLVFDDGGQQRNRPATAVQFEDGATGDEFVFVSNHFKSKGPSRLSDENDPNFDQGDGQGFWNAARTDAANQLTAWLENHAVFGLEEDRLIVGDLNAYAEEDPVQAIEAAGYINLLDRIGNDKAYSFVFDGQQGALDHGLATASLDAKIKDVVEWHINADEPDLLSYNSRFNDAGFYNGSDVFASSDHDIMILGLDLGDTLIG